MSSPSSAAPKQPEQATMSFPAPSSALPSPILVLPAPNILVRPFSPHDIPSLTHEANNPLVASHLRNTFPHPYTQHDAQTWISISTTASPLTDFAICRASDNTLIGGIGLKPQSDVNHRTLELGYWLGEEHWGKGIATAAVGAFTEWAFAEWKKVIRIEAVVFEGHEASIKVLRKAGFEWEARMRNCVEKEGKVMGVEVWVRFGNGFE